MQGALEPSLMDDIFNKTFDHALKSERIMMGPSATNPNILLNSPTFNQLQEGTSSYYRILNANPSF